MIGPLEGILFLVGTEGINKNDLMRILEVNNEELDKLIGGLQEMYNDQNRGLQLEIFGDMCKLITKKEHNLIYSKLVSIDIDRPLTTSALEVLAIIAYNEPITRTKIDEIRGVSSSHLVRRLLLKDLIEEAGRAETAGRPILYKTTSGFLDCFGIKNLDELPKIELCEKELEETDLFSSKYTENI